jgi:hypothetical protein
MPLFTLLQTLRDSSSMAAAEYNLFLKVTRPPQKKKKNHANVSYKKPLFCHPGQDFLDPDFKGTAGSCFLQKKMASTTRWTLQVG